MLEEESIICVCNSTYCDTIEEIQEADIENGSFVRYESSMSGKRMYFTKGRFLKRMEPRNFIAKIIRYWTETKFTVDSNVTYQQMFGFGGGFTDTVTVILKRASEQLREQLLRQYFGNEGLNYTLLRISMGASDFSPRFYTYDDNGTGHSLSTFNLTVEDYEYKIPLLKRAINMSTGPIRLIASPWAAPMRMKYTLFDLGLIVVERLKKEYYQTFAQYFIKFLDAYKKEGLKMWALTIQNEPLNAYVGIPPRVSVAWPIKEQALFINQNLGPLLNSTGYGNIKILALDEDWIFNTITASTIMKYAGKYVSGTAYHSYFQSLTHPSVLTRLHNLFPDKFLIHTEFSIIFTGFFKPRVRLGRWINMEYYAIGLFDALNNWVTGYMDWNMILDEQGGPGFLGNRLDASIIINSTTYEEFYKQSSWYAMAHFAHFIPSGSIRIELREWRALGIMSTAVLTPENRVVIVMMNRRDEPWDIVINVGNDDQIEATLTARSINTFIYKLKAPLHFKNDETTEEEKEKEEKEKEEKEKEEANLSSGTHGGPEQEARNEPSFSFSYNQCNLDVLTLSILSFMLFQLI